jgi:ABC-type transport system involved in multi-copper enzyme maturation permease subunit
MPAQKPNKRALRAWAKSSVICLVASPAIFLLWDLFESSPSHGVGSASAQIGLFLAVAGIAAGVHLLAFLLFGLPMFLSFYSLPDSVLWRWMPGVLTGTIIGIASVPLTLSVLYSRPFTQGLLESALAGAIYGGITALACLLNRPNVEQVVAPNRSLPLTLNPTSSVRGSEDF